MTDDKTLLSRRTVLKGSGASLGAAAVGVGGLVYSSQPALAGNGGIDASDVFVNEDVNNIDEVTLDPSGLNFDWDNFSSGVDSFDIDIEVKEATQQDEEYGHIYQLSEVKDADDGDVETFDVEGELSETNSNVTVDLSGKGVVADGPLEATDLPSNVEDGQSDDVNLEIRTTVTANNAGSGGDATAQNSHVFNVELDNPSGETNAVGTVETTADTS